jgi:hypothetical protein
MLKSFLPVSLLLSASLAAQITLSTGLTANNQGNSGGGLYFDLQVNTTISITQLNHWVGSNGTTSGNLALDLYLGPSTYVGNVTDPSRWTNVGTATMTGYTYMASTYQLLPFVFATPITLAPGSYGIALKSQSAAPAGTVVWNNAYTNGVTCTSTTVPGSCSNTLFSNAQITIRGGAAQNAFLSGSIFTPRMFGGSITYTLGGTPIQVAAYQTYGKGCNAFNTSYGEIFGNPSTSLDVTGTTHLLTFAGSAYVVTGTASNTYVAPSASAVILPLSLNTDIASVATALGGQLPFPILFPRAGGVGVADDLEVCSSGFITPIDVATNGATAVAPGTQIGDSSPTLGEFFGTGYARWVPLWQNMVPVGNVYAEVVGSRIVITWANVIVSGYTTGNTFQFAVDNTGNVEFRYDTAQLGIGGGGVPVVIGLTQGGGALENEIDVSADVLTGFATHPLDNTPLTLGIDARPVLGSNPNYIINKYDSASTALGVVLIDFGQHNPGLPLAVYGMPGCSQYTNPTAIRTFFTNGQAQVTIPFITGGIPNSLTFNGITFFAQALTITGQCAGGPCNARNVIASNGLALTLGTL